MAFIYPDIIRPRIRRLGTLVNAGVTGAFARAAVAGGCAVALLGLALPGASPGAIGVALAVYGAATAVTGWFLHRDYPHADLGLCNYVTLTRFVLICALMVPMIAGSGPSWTFFGMAVVALALDGIDGWLARRQGLTSAFGARFDLEADSVLALVLALNAALYTQIGLWAALLGLPRYLFGAAGLVLPWLNQPLPERFSRKVVCVLQLAVLIALQAPVLPLSVAVMLVPLVGAALLWSFALDLVWLRRHGR